MRIITFTADDRKALAHDRYHHPDPRVQRKMEVLWLKSHDLPHDRIATLAGVSRRTVQRYIEDFEAGRKEADFTPYVGIDLGPKELCRLHGTWYEHFGGST